MGSLAAATLALGMGLGVALAGPAGAGAVLNAGTGRVSVTIDSMTPQYAKTGATVTVTGSVSNGTGQTQAGLQVQLYTSADHFTSRDGMDAFVAHGTGASLVPAGTLVALPGSVRPGVSVSWRASFLVDAEGISEFGVYPVTAQLADSFGDVLTSAQTLLPFWPGQRAAGLAHPVNISWLWPLIDQPHHLVCSALLNNDLAASLSQGGRLSALLLAGVGNPGADLTWVMDPALLGDAVTMTVAYRVNPQPNCTEAVRQPASQAAANWLSALKRATSDQPAVLTPYANVDMTALVNQGLDADLASAYAQGDAVARSVLGSTFSPKVAWPAGGTTNLSVLTNLSTADGIKTVVLSSSEMPPAETSTFEPDDAVTSVHTGAGTTMNVLLADSTLSGVLAAGDTGSGVLSQNTTFAVRQRFLAETAMIAAEAPDSQRSLVVAPPQDWSPSQGLASDLLGETVSAPWLKPATLASLTTAPDSEAAIARQQPPASKPSRGELSRGYLKQVATLGVRLGVYKSLLYQPSLKDVQPLSQALAALESSAWRGGGSAQGSALAARLTEYLAGAENKVEIIASHQVPMGGASGPVPVVIQNRLNHTIQVRVNTSVQNTPSRPSQLTIGRFQNVIVLRPNQALTVRLPVRSAPQGSTAIQVSLATADGKPLLSPGVTLYVESTRYGRAILFLIGAAVGVFVLSSVYRGVRRRLRDDAHVVHEEADAPGSVVTGTSARYPTEAPDDLADARRWADDA